MRAQELVSPLGADAIFSGLPEGARVWLDGDAAHPDGRWSFVGCEPVEVLRVPFGARRPWECLRAIGAAGDAVEGAEGAPSASEVPWWIGYVAYDAAWSDPASLGLRTPVRLPRSTLPVLWMARFETLFAIDHASKRVFVLGPDDRACHEMIGRLGEPRAVRARVGSLAVEPIELHRQAILRALSSISAGDIYQVNLARRWSVDYRGSALPLFLRMRQASPVPFGLFVEAGDHAVAARTMERFLRWDRASGEISSCPIKGTIARGGDDRGEADALVSDDKERAEHSMIVDLMRNDLSRVAVPGSVRVSDALRVERFAALSHLVSTVSARTIVGASIDTLLDATFPPGSVTGTPKLKAIEMIEALERSARGVYTGAVGYLDRQGGLSLAVAIRTAVVHENIASYFAGGGLVSASDPDREIAETELKARVFLEALDGLVV